MSRGERGHRFTVPGARDPRSRQTPAEETLWDAIRGRKLADLKFRRQHLNSPFVADFCCPDRRLTVEVDGGIHDAQVEHDGEREALLTAAGYRVLRNHNEVITNDLLTALDRIRDAAFEQRPVPSTERSRTGGW